MSAESLWLSWSSEHVLSDEDAKLLYEQLWEPPVTLSAAPPAGVDDDDDDDDDEHRDAVVPSVDTRQLLPPLAEVQHKLRPVYQRAPLENQVHRGGAPRTVRLLVVGPQGVGKSELINTLYRYGLPSDRACCPGAACMIVTHPHSDAGREVLPEMQWALAHGAPGAAHGFLRDEAAAAQSHPFSVRRLTLGEQHQVHRVYMGDEVVAEAATIHFDWPFAAAPADIPSADGPGGNWQAQVLEVRGLDEQASVSVWRRRLQVATWWPSAAAASSSNADGDDHRRGRDWDAVLWVMRLGDERQRAAQRLLQALPRRYLQKVVLVLTHGATLPPASYARPNTDDAVGTQAYTGYARERIDAWRQRVRARQADDTAVPAVVLDFGVRPAAAAAAAAAVDDEAIGKASLPLWYSELLQQTLMQVVRARHAENGEKRSGRTPTWGQRAHQMANAAMVLAFLWAAHRSTPAAHTSTDAREAGAAAPPFWQFWRRRPPTSPAPSSSPTRYPAHRRQRATSAARQAARGRRPRPSKSSAAERRDDFPIGAL